MLKIPPDLPCLPAGRLCQKEGETAPFSKGDWGDYRFLLRIWHSALSAFRFLKLPEEPHIIREEESYIIDPEFEHGDPFDPHSKCKTGHFHRVIIYKSEDSRVCHTRT